MPQNAYAMISHFLLGFYYVKKQIRYLGGKNAMQVCPHSRNASFFALSGALGWIWSVFVPIRTEKNCVCVDAALKIEMGAIFFYD